MTVAVTQFTKGLPVISRVPTRLWSAIIAFCVLLAAQAFTSGITAQGAILTLFNAILVSLAANGGYDALSHTLGRRNEE